MIRPTLTFEIACLAAMLFGPWALADETQAAKKPNFIVFVVDDMSFGDAGTYGSRMYETPNIDRIAGRGMKFYRSYAASPVGGPTRASILTGKYPARLGMTDNIGEPQTGEPPKRPGDGKPLLPASTVDHLPQGEATLAQTLQTHGYATWFVGKWDLGGPGYLPENFGFDTNVGGFPVASPLSYFAPFHNPKLPDGPTGEHLDERLTAESIKLLDHAGTKPFLLLHCFYSLHLPLEARKELIPKYEAKQKLLDQRYGNQIFIKENGLVTRRFQDNPVYAAMVETMDRCVGDIIDEVDRLELTENTIVIFTSSNGGVGTTDIAPTCTYGFSGGKGMLYEGGIRVPLIIDWPGAVAMGKQAATPVISMDLYPTILEMANLPAPPKLHLDGVSLVPVLKHAGKLETRPLFWHFPHYGPYGGSPASAIFDGGRKLIEYFEGDRLELFNFRNSTLEKPGAAPTQAKYAAEMREKLNAWRTEVGARLPTPNPKAKPAP